MKTPIFYCADVEKGAHRRAIDDNVLIVTPGKIILPGERIRVLSKQEAHHTVDMLHGKGRISDQQVQTLHRNISSSAMIDCLPNKVLVAMIYDALEECSNSNRESTQ